MLAVSEETHVGRLPVRSRSVWTQQPSSIMATVIKSIFGMSHFPREFISQLYLCRHKLIGAKWTPFMRMYQVSCCLDKANCMLRAISAFSHCVIKAAGVCSFVVLRLSLHSVSYSINQFNPIFICIAPNPDIHRLKELYNPYVRGMIPVLKVREHLSKTHQLVCSCPGFTYKAPVLSWNHLIVLSPPESGCSAWLSVCRDFKRDSKKCVGYNVVSIYLSPDMGICLWCWSFGTTNQGLASREEYSNIRSCLLAYLWLPGHDTRWRGSRLPKPPSFIEWSLITQRTKVAL